MLRLTKFFKIVILYNICLLSSINLLGQSDEKATFEPYKEDYKGYTPDFIAKLKSDKGFKVSDKEMELSSETTFYTLNEVEEVNRANALVKVAVENEMNGDYRKAMTMYQDIITKFSVSGNNEVLYRVSSFGVFVPIAQYCQRRLLKFPAEHLTFFRTLRDPEAKELFDDAVKKYSLELFSEIVDKYLATSYGGRSLQFLGDAALDRGNYLEALEYFKTIEEFIPDKNVQTPELKLKIQLCEKLLGKKSSGGTSNSKSAISEKDLQAFKSIVQAATPTKSKILTQKNSSEYTSGDDYTRFDPTSDPLGIVEPEWENDLLASRNDYFVYAQPVATDTSIVVRMKNIIYCYSILNGNLRWKNDIGGRSTWQNWFARQYPLEDVVVQDGVIVTPIIKGGPSLVALDEVTGQIKWSYGPMSASDGDESLMRFEAAPTGGPGTIYAGYILDNIKGDTHIDSEYGVIAFESTTGRVKWRRQICRLLPGKFEASFGGNVRRNRIRSFSSPPLYHEGTVYATSNAGAVVAMDSLSGRIKWLMRYPYYMGVHDLTRQFGQLYVLHGGSSYVQPHGPMFWLNQRPLVVDENVYVLPVDSPFMYCLDRKTGKINWSFRKPTGGFSYFLGPISTGELVMTGNGRASDYQPNAFEARDPLYLLDPKTGNVTWKAPDIVMKDSQPVMNAGQWQYGGTSINNRYFETAARPFLMSNDRIIITCWTDNSVYYRPGMQVFALGELDLVNKKVLSQRRFYTGPLLANCDQVITDKESRNGPYPLGAPLTYEDLSKLPVQDAKVKEKMAALKKIMEDTVPVNEYPMFLPFSRLTFSRYGVPFELRLTPRKIQMIYKRNDLEAKLSSDNTLIGFFGKSEIAIKDGEYKKAAEYLNQCLALVSPEDINFRALIKQQFYKVYLGLVRSAIRANKPKEQLDSALGMSSTASVLSEEIETLFVLAEAYMQNKNYTKAGLCLRTLIEIYGDHEFPISSLAAKSSFYKQDMPEILKTYDEIFQNSKENTGTVYKKEWLRFIDLTKQSSSLYTSAVSPLPKELVVRTGDLAILKLVELLKSADGYEAEYSKAGDTELSGDKLEQQLFHIWKYPGTTKGQAAFQKIVTAAASLPDEEKRSVWRKLGYIARICGFKVSGDLGAFLATPKAFVGKDIAEGKSKTFEIGGFKDGVMITMERGGDQTLHSNLIFISVKIPKKVGYRFSVVCYDLAADKEVWRKEEFRLKDLGKEPGFFKANVYNDVVVVNGIYDVFAFNIKDGSDIWHYKTPYGFEIYETTMSGNIFVLGGAVETIALQVDTKSPIGEVAWQQKEDGNIYYKPYFVDNLLISIRKYPFNITSRDRTTGSLTMRLAIPDLSLVEEHPVLKEGALALPIAIYGKYLAVTDEKYLIVYDVIKMEMVWKTLLTEVDASKDLKMRLTISDKYVVMLKEDYDRKALYGFSLETGDILWFTDPKNSGSPQAIYSTILEGDTLYGIGTHAGQAFYFVAYDCVTGKLKYRKEFKDYGGVPEVSLYPVVYGKHLVAIVQDRKDFQMIVLDKTKGDAVRKVEDKGDGPIGDVGRVATTIQNSLPVLFSKTHFKY